MCIRVCVIVNINHLEKTSAATKKKLELRKTANKARLWNERGSPIPSISITGKKVLGQGKLLGRCSDSTGGHSQEKPPDDWNASHSVTVA